MYVSYHSAKTSSRDVSPGLAGRNWTGASAPLRRGHTGHSSLQRHRNRSTTSSRSHRTAPRPSRRRAHRAGANVADQRSWVRPPPRRGQRSRGSECRPVVLRWGSRRRPRRGLHPDIAIPWLSKPLAASISDRPRIAARPPELAISRRRTGGTFPLTSSVISVSLVGRLRFLLQSPSPNRSCGSQSKQYFFPHKLCA